MVWVTVFQGTSGSAHVVAGVLRSGGVDADVTPTFGMYPGGPLLIQYVRVHEDSLGRARKILESARSTAPKKISPLDYSTPVWIRIVAFIALVAWLFARF